MKILCFGDSNTWGYDPRSYFGSRYDTPWPEHLARISGWEVINDGLNGREIPDRMTHPSCDLLILMLGTNDLLQRSPPEQVSARMEALLKPLTVPVLLISPPPMARGEWTEESVIFRSRTLSNQYAALAAELGVLFCDAGSWNLSLCYDGVHLTEESHIAFAEKLHTFLKKHLFP